MRTFLAFPLVVALLLGSAAPAVASHMGQYGGNPVERDDQGRGIEPDGRSTGVLGPGAGNRVVDLGGDGVAEPDAALPPPGPGHAAQVNPGCTGEDGRKLSGQCGLWTVGLPPAVPPGTVPPPVSEPGACVTNPRGEASGRFSGPCQALRPVRFLDALQTACASASGVHYVEVNRKLDDAAASLGLGGSAADRDLVLGPTCLWAWYGEWVDRNGNGVIDSRATFNVPAQGIPCDAPCDGDPVAVHFPDEEFTWLGRCDQLGNPPTHNPRSVRSGYCKLDVEGAATTMVGWLYPGNHHSYLGGFPLDPVLCAVCFYEPIDFPGRQAVSFVGSVVFHATGGATAGPCDVIFCELDPDDLDSADEEFAGDPLLGPQDSVRVDQAFSDRAGDPSAGTRQWLYGLGWATWFYDQSVLVRLIQATGVGCRPGGATVYLPATCRFLDVDELEAWNPFVEDLVQAQLKPTLRANWVLVRDNWDAAQRNVDAALNHRLVAATAALGPVDDAALDPGFSREPNEPGDRYPGAVHAAAACALPGDAERLHRGWCNRYDAHRAAALPYGDVQARIAVMLRPVLVNTLTVASVAGALVATTADPLAPAGGPVREEGDHRRTLAPGEHQFVGRVGWWQDLPHAWTEEVLLEVPELGIVGGPHANPPDGWVGNLVATLGAWYYRGYADEDCGATDQPPWVDLDGDGVAEGHSYAECHPYLDGDVQDPQGYGGAGSDEWHAECGRITAGGDVPAPAGAPGGVLTLTPADGTWGPAPVLVWRDWAAGLRLRTGPPPALLHGLVDLTGVQGPVELRMRCWSDGGVEPLDTLVLPLGNLGETFTARLEVDLGGHRLVDEDTYHGWGAAL